MWEKRGQTISSCAGLILYVVLCHERLKGDQFVDFSRTQRLIHDIDQFRSEPDGLLNALQPHQHHFGYLEKRLIQGVLLFRLSSISLEIRHDDEMMNRYFQNPGHFEEEQFNFLVAHTLESAYIVFKTWVALVYMRSDEVEKTFGQIRHSSRHLGLYIRLLRDDYVRHIRNALSHGTFDAESGIFHWTDDQHSGQLPYNDLEKINNHMFTLWLTMMACSFGSNQERGSTQ